MNNYYLPSKWFSQKNSLFRFINNFPPNTYTYLQISCLDCDKNFQLSVLLKTMNTFMEMNDFHLHSS